MHSKQKIWGLKNKELIRLFYTVALLKPEDTEDTQAISSDLPSSFFDSPLPENKAIPLAYTIAPVKARLLGGALRKAAPKKEETVNMTTLAGNDTLNAKIGDVTPEGLVLCDSYMDVQTGETNYILGLPNYLSEKLSWYDGEELIEQINKQKIYTEKYGLLKHPTGYEGGVNMLDLIRQNKNQIGFQHLSHDRCYLWGKAMDDVGNENFAYCLDLNNNYTVAHVNNKKYGATILPVAKITADEITAKEITFMPPLAKTSNKSNLNPLTLAGKAQQHACEHAHG